MKKIIIGTYIVVLAFMLLSLAAFASAKSPGWGKIKSDWDLTFVYGGNDYNHHMIIDYLDRKTGDFSGTGYYMSGPITWTVKGIIDGSDVEFTIDYDSSGYYVDVVGTISNDGNTMSGDWSNSSQSGTWTGEATYENHGQYVKSQGDKKEAAQSRIGMPLHSKGHTK